MTEKTSYIKGSTGIGMVVQIVFVILKICKLGKIGEWPWWKVMLPTICSCLLCLLLCCCTVCCICCSNKIQKNKQKNITMKELPELNVTTKKINIPYSETINFDDNV